MEYGPIVYSYQRIKPDSHKSTVAQKCHGNFNFTHGNFNFFTAISIYSRQFKFTLAWAISTCSRQFQHTQGNFNLLTAISTCPRQFQFVHGNFNLLTAISICSRQFQFTHMSAELVKKSQQNLLVKRVAFKDG